MRIPTEVRDIILNYKDGMEHWERYEPVLREVVQMYYTMKRIRLNLEFDTMFFPDWSAHIIPFPFPHLVEFHDMPDLEHESEPDA